MSEKFSRFESMDACTTEMARLGHDPESCNKICSTIKDRAEKGALLKAQQTSLQVVSKADEEDIVLYGYASWDCVDDDGDVFTVDAQRKALERFFSQPPEYQLITVNHGRGSLGEVKAAQPLLKYTNKAGETFYSHVNEIGTPLLSKIRNDKLASTQWIRSKAKAGELNGYSVNAIPLEKDPSDPHRVLDMEYTAITITTKGDFKPRNPMARDVKVLKAVEKCDCDTDVCGGACCQFITQHYPGNVEKAYFVSHGLEVKESSDGFFVKYPAVCKAFDSESKRCKDWLHRPDSCRVYPQQESPFIAKAKCSLLLAREKAKMKAESYTKNPTLNESKTLDIEDILQKHGFNKCSHA